MTTVPLLEFLMPLRTVSALNVREHPKARARRVKHEHDITVEFLDIAANGLDLASKLPLRITLTRISPKARWLPLKACYQAVDDDAVPGAMKGVRDAIAEWLGVDDGDERLWFQYAQDRGEFGVRVSMEPEPGRVPMPDPQPRRRSRKAKLGRDPLAIDRSRGGGTANMRPAQRFTIVRSDT